MWLLSTDRAELRFFATPNDVPMGYAILSHVWDKEEQTFQDIQNLRSQCTASGAKPRDLASPKIKNFCVLAESHGCRWAGIDTCCIDKTSSSELSEAINSMFRYYSLAAICYGHLRDVDTVAFSRRDLEDRDNYRCHPQYEKLRRSIWFERGWTLQELIAPRFFVFLSSSWDVIGTKADLADFLEADFDIPATVLRLLASPSQFSISYRMSWFRQRRTTRPEDEAYCLLGLFDVHMPPLYGEGRNAFRRLQEEIMKQSEDTTLFAWIGSHSEYNSTRQFLFAAQPADFFSSRFSGEIAYAPPRRTHVVPDTIDNVSMWVFGVGSELLMLMTMMIEQDSALAVRPDVDRMTFAITPTGVRANVPTFTRNGTVFADLYWLYRGVDRLYLALEPDSDNAASSCDRLSYHVCQFRLTHYPFDEPPSWKEVLIRHRPPLLLAPGELPASFTSSFIPAISMQLTLDAFVRFPETRIRQFLKQSGSERIQIRGGGFDSPDSTAASNLPTAYIFTRFCDFVVIRVGYCQQGWSHGEQCRPKGIWARAVISDDQINDAAREVKINKVSTDPLHDCSQDHVLQWPDLQKMFPMNRKQVTLSFTPCPLNPERTLVLTASYLWY